MEIKEAVLSAVGVNFSQYPSDGKPEIAFVGKSNVGKSTLINTMVERKSLARTSSQPGKTRTINFYGINNEFYIVDVPGYGYMQKRQTLVGVVLLIDIRHEPGENDRIMYDWLKHYGYKIIIAATKKDKIKRSQIKKNVSIIKKSLGLGNDDFIVPYSGVDKSGKEELWDIIEKEFNL